MPLRPVRRRAEGEGSPAPGRGGDLVEIISAIEHGEIDALVLPTPRGDCIFTCWTDEHPYRTLVEAMSEGAVTLSPEGMVLYCNTAFARIIGSSLDRVIGSDLAAWVVPADAARWLSLLKQACQEASRMELSLLSYSRRAVPVYVSAQPLQGAGQCRICAVVTDLTEVDAARQAQLQLAAIVEASGDAILSTTPEGVVSSWNRGAERLLGYTAGEMIGRPILDTIPVERCGELLSLLERVRAGSSVEHVELVQLRRDGTAIDVVLTLAPICDRQGRIVAASAIAHDNTAQRRAHRRLQSVLESAPDAILVVNHNGQIVLVNTQAEILFGYRREQMIGQPIALLMPRRLHEFLRTMCEQEPQNRLPGVRHEACAIRADGREFPAEISVAAVETEEGTLMCGSFRDVSERYAFQQTLREKNVQLQAALQAKDRFLATMSHELRTPLTAIIGFVGILLMKLAGPLTAAQEQQLLTVRSSARHLQAIIGDLLDLARIDSGKVELQVETVCCGEVLEEVAGELAQVAEQRNLKFHLEVPPNRIELETDRRLLRQILTNLAGNAIKFTDQGWVRISLREIFGGSRLQVVFAVSDTGIGIQAFDLARIFTEFCRVQTRSADDREGTGLGLHISQKLALLLGGQIEAESEVGKGSTFTLTLPSRAGA